MVLEAYNDSYYTTGVTYQADNQPTPTTVKGAGVDVSVLPIIGLSGRVDWGVHAYDPTGTNGVDPQNGGIVGTVSYDTTRNELDPQYAAAEDWQPGISGVPVELYAPVAVRHDRRHAVRRGRPLRARRRRLLRPGQAPEHLRHRDLGAADAAARPATSTATRSSHGVDENVLVADAGRPTGECISSFMQGVQFGPYPTDQGTPDANFGAAVNGNYGFGDGCFDRRPSTPTDPVEPASATAATVRRRCRPPTTWSTSAIPNDATGQARCTR